ncbi:MAG: hypothetical protein FWF63_04585 [Fibromonadales bacterium]|nr:hypothetical protein [Fibromonadales bacterium]
MIKVNSFTGSQIITEFAGKDLWRLSSPVYVDVFTNEGKLRYTMLAGFPTNMRSGSHLIDFIIPKFTKNNQYNLALLCHDFAYTKNEFYGNYLPRAEADELLRQMCILSGELGTVRAGIMYGALRVFGGAAYEEDNTGDYAGAEELMGFRKWDK